MSCDELADQTVRFYEQSFMEHNHLCNVTCTQTVSKSKGAKTEE